MEERIRTYRTREGKIVLDQRKKVLRHITFINLSFAKIDLLRNIKKCDTEEGRRTHTHIYIYLANE